MRSPDGPPSRSPQSRCSRKNPSRSRSSRWLTASSALVRRAPPAARARSRRRRGGDGRALRRHQSRMVASGGRTLERGPARLRAELVDPAVALRRERPAGVRAARRLAVPTLVMDVELVVASGVAAHGLSVRLTVARCMRVTNGDGVASPPAARSARHTRRTRVTPARPSRRPSRSPQSRCSRKKASKSRSRR
jgi:hypothetical protein